jgi:hypothetical protein
MKARAGQREGIDDQILSDPAHYESLSLTGERFNTLGSLERYVLLSSWLYARGRNKTTHEACLSVTALVKSAVVQDSSASLALPQHCVTSCDRNY